MDAFDQMVEQLKQMQQYYNVVENNNHVIGGAVLDIIGFDPDTDKLSLKEVVEKLYEIAGKTPSEEMQELLTTD